MLLARLRDPEGGFGANFSNIEAAAEKAFLCVPTSQTSDKARFHGKTPSNSLKAQAGSSGYKKYFKFTGPKLGL